MQKLNLSPTQKRALKFARTNNSRSILNNSLVNSDNILINNLDFYLYLNLETDAEQCYLADNNTLKNGFLTDANLDINEYPLPDNFLYTQPIRLHLPSICVEKYASDDLGRIALNSVILLDDNYFATDGHRAWLGNGNATNKGEIISIPREFIDMTRKIFGKNLDQVKIFTQKLDRVSYYTAFGHDVTLHYCAKNDDLYPYPSIQNVIPSEYTHESILSKMDTMKIKQIYKDFKKVLPKTKQAIFEGQKMYYLPDHYIKIDANFALKISFNLEYLTQIFNDLGNNDIDIRYNTSVGAAILDNAVNSALLMPLRIVE